ncbi:hypothetical protein HPB47_005422 [Ixodes persulcatus]|uniref:Uncharacterized protein n=1 Tax=Ixodes persulcatus TaxID=34615 RepID=A0AC60PEC2_IXOPE|nr:hypothetical protein HPB47_005422 [Ixodes persulcatus]
MHEGQKQTAPSTEVQPKYLLRVLAAQEGEGTAKGSCLSDLAEAITGKGKKEEAAFRKSAEKSHTSSDSDGPSAHDSEMRQAENSFWKKCTLLQEDNLFLQEQLKGYQRFSAPKSFNPEKSHTSSDSDGPSAHDSEMRQAESSFWKEKCTPLQEDNLFLQDQLKGYQRFSAPKCFNHDGGSAPKQTNLYGGGDGGVEKRVEAASHNAQRAAAA